MDCFLYLIKGTSQTHIKVSLCTALHKLLGKVQNIDDQWCGGKESWRCVLGKTLSLRVLPLPIDSYCAKVKARARSWCSVPISKVRSFAPHSQAFAHETSCSHLESNNEGKRVAIPRVLNMKQKKMPRDVFFMECRAF